MGVAAAEGRVREANRTALLVLGRSEADGDFADLFLAEEERVEGRQALRLMWNEEPMKPKVTEAPGARAKFQLGPEKRYPPVVLVAVASHVELMLLA